MDRRSDRLVAMVAVAIGLVYLCAAVLTAFLPAATRIGSWLPLHLALAGGASTAIAGVMPFFSAAFATAQPLDARLRWGSVTAVALGALGVAIGYAGSLTVLAVAGGAAFMTGMGLTAYATVAPVRRGLGPKGGVVTFGYVAALLMVITGALLATLFLAGWQPIAEAWGHLKPVHAWLNLVGFVSLVIATTLLHLFPTVIGARILRTPAAYLTVTGLAVGTVLVASGFASSSDWLVRAGAVSLIAGAAGLAGYAGLTWRGRAAWTGDAGWHGFAIGGLVSAIAWFELGALLASARLLVAGADPAAATATVLLGPLVLGWMGLALLASATHLVPAIGPGDPAGHARQRRLLGAAAIPRLAAADAGIAAVSLGTPLGSDILVMAGMLLAAFSLAWTAGLLATAVAIGLRSARASGNLVA